MRLRKMAVGIFAAAMAAVSIPQAVSAVDFGVDFGGEFNVGDRFYVTFDTNTGAVTSGASDKFIENDDDICYMCRVLEGKAVNLSMVMGDPANKDNFKGKKITFPDKIEEFTVTELGNNQGDFSSITIPDTVIKVGGFGSNENLEEIIFGANTQIIEGYAFNNCTALESITIPANIEEIGMHAFALCYKLKNVTFEANSKLKSIGEEAFMNAASLESITLPASVETVGEAAFSDKLAGGYSTEGTSAIKNIFVDENSTSFKSVDGVLYSKDGTELVAFPPAKGGDYTIPNGVVKICRSAFRDSLVTSVTIPSGVTEILRNTFYCCYRLEKVDLPDTLVSIEAAFEGAHMDYIIIPESVKEIDRYAFVRIMSNEIFLSAIYGTPGSYAETYAQENYIEFRDVAELDKPDKPTEPNTFTDEKTGIKAVDKNNVLPENAEMSVKERMVASEEASYIVFFLDGNDKIYETAEEVEMWIPVPEVMLKSIPNLNRLDVFVTLDHHQVKLDHEYKDGYVVFDTSIFGEFRIVDRYAGITDDTYPGPGTNTGTVTDEETGISVSGAVPEGAQLKVTADTENSTDTKLFYDISLTKDGEEVQPNGTVTVKIPVPTGLQDKVSELKVYHLVDGKYTDMNARYENGFMVFTTDHFSVYVVTSDNIENPDDTTASEPAPAVPTIPSGSFQVPETTTAAATTTEAAPAATEAADNSTANTAAAATTTTTTAAVAAPADTDSNSGDTTQSVVSEDNGSDNSTADNGAANVGNDGAANDKGENPDTGSTIAIVPMIVAAAAVSFFAYKRKK